MTIASIDDLLEYDDEEEPAARQRRTRWMWLRVALIAGAWTAVVVVGLRLLDFDISIVAVFAAILAVLLLRRLVATVASPAPRQVGVTASGEEDGHYNWDSRDALRHAVGRWERAFQWCQQDGERFSRILVPALRELTEERLRLRHGLSLVTDATRAREMLGEPLWDLLHNPTARPPKPQQLAMYVSTLEEL